MSDLSAEVTIVGSGAAGVAAALRLSDRGVKCLLVDVGFDPPQVPYPSANLYDLRVDHDLFSLLIGANLERVRHFATSAIPIPAKLTAPGFDFVTRCSAELSPVKATGFAPVQSFACGGLANAWGAGLYRYTSRDLKGFPIGPADLEKYYDRLDEEIGISGTADDLASFFGYGGFNQPPLRMSRKASYLLKRYILARKRLNRCGVFLGRPRLGVLSEPRNGRPACDYSNLEFWVPRLPWLYVPSMTLERLVRAGAVSYLKGMLALCWEQSGDRVTLHIRECQSGVRRTVATRFLLLAAGAIGSARLALASREDYHSKLTLLDNPALQFPLLIPRFIGAALEVNCFGLTQLNVIFETDKERPPLQGSILEITSPARSEFFPALPFAAKDNLAFIRYLVPAMLVLQLFLPCSEKTGSALSLSRSGYLNIEGEEIPVDGEIIRLVVRSLRSMGAVTHRKLLVKPPLGHGLHYAGTLPMTACPQSPYQCDRYCQLQGQRGVFVVDGSVFPHLPAKNYSYTVMANAMRVADHIASQLQM